MGIRLAAGAAFGAASLITPSLKGVLRVGLHGTSEAETIRNRANPALPASIIGAPPFQDGYIETSGNAPAGLKGLDLNIVPPDGDCCLIVAARRQTSGAILASVGPNADGQNVDFGIWGSSTGPKFRNSTASSAGEAIAPWLSSSPTDFFVIFAWGVARGWPNIRIGYGGALGPVYSGPQSLASGVPKRALSGNLIINPDVEGNASGATGMDMVLDTIPSDAEMLAIYRRYWARENQLARIGVA